MTESAPTRVSIIIPHMNQPAFLENCLASLAPQVAALAGTEVIVVDNGSRQLPEATCARYSFVRLAQEKEPGPGPARNHGIGLSTGAILAFIDADCVAHANWLSSLVDEFNRHPAVQVLGGDVRIGLADPARPTMLEAYESVFAYRQKEYIEKLGFSGTGNLAMRRAVHSEVGPFAGIAVAEDRDWGRRATARGFTIRYVPGMIVYHPARKTFAELRRKWDRHIAHDFEERVSGPAGKVKWLALAAAVTLSGVADIRKILVSRRIGTWRERLLAAVMLVRIRLYRAWTMVRLIGSSAQPSSHGWNRQ